MRISFGCGLDSRIYGTYSTSCVSAYFNLSHAYANEHNGDDSPKDSPKNKKAIYYERDTERLSRNCCYRRKAIINTYSECVFVALGIQHAMRMHHIAICGLSRLYRIFPLYLANGTILGRKSY